MSDKDRLQAFLADLVAVCQKHNMEIVSTDYSRLVLGPWPATGNANSFESCLVVVDIAPDGARWGIEHE